MLGYNIRGEARIPNNTNNLGNTGNPYKHSLYLHVVS